MKCFVKMCKCKKVKDIRSGLDGMMIIYIILSQFIATRSQSGKIFENQIIIVETLTKRIKIKRKRNTCQIG